MKITNTNNIQTANTKYRYYALHWSCGYGCAHAISGKDYANVYGFKSKAARDAACEDFHAPNHCPQAALEPVPSSNRNVRKAVRGTTGYGDCEANSDVMEWAAKINADEAWVLIGETDNIAMEVL